MPRSAGQREHTRERILTAAAAAFRRRGYTATGVDAVMADAGLTHGGFYAHFSSKSELLTQALAHARRPEVNLLLLTTVGLAGPALIRAVIDAYLSMRHRDHPEDGCPLPTLGAELPRLEGEVAALLAEPLARLAERLAPHLPCPAPQQGALAQALIAMCVGGIVTARALSPAKAKQWLASCRTHARQLAGLAEEQT